MDRNGFTSRPMRRMRQYTRTAAYRRGFNPYTDEQSLQLDMQEAVLTDPANAFFDWLVDSLRV